MVLLSGIEDVGEVVQLAVAAGKPEVPLAVLPKIVRLRKESERRGKQTVGGRNITTAYLRILAVHNQRVCVDGWESTVRCEESDACYDIPGRY